ncbi:MAG: helix-turn-helix domain-containing protein [Planctomycetota bacterium]
MRYVFARLRRAVRGHQRLRLQRACGLLRRSDLTLSEVAAQSCFAHARHLCAAFGTAHGMTPGAWRAAASAQERSPGAGT